jgi:hypothetical protein
MVGGVRSRCVVDDGHHIVAHNLTNMFAVYQSCDRWAPPAVSAWLSTHNIDPARRWRSEDAAMLKVCEQVAACVYSVRIDPGEPTSTRSAQGSITARYPALHVTFVIRRMTQ